MNTPYFWPTFGLNEPEPFEDEPGEMSDADFLYAYRSGHNPYSRL